jgi:hypothetical protein
MLILVTKIQMVIDLIGMVLTTWIVITAPVKRISAQSSCRKWSEVDSALHPAAPEAEGGHI